ncbi:ABC transporter substrate-binding protein [Bosea sp. (in: a-proteobacteria)]|uniref:ABC transporter substrate-binding protein n=1 Tax=Bosea sp. (in: a-proteobacteria) TaxID=1871050 RepID=UPI002639A518|nr:ABC transporter substrate-binding protein [Bosea sp. (in: a-proteobacteria)]MCO5091241.1 ABC transporter substrate-binding protein [Bosea sp. (in: a-proteobacteria)]
MTDDVAGKTTLSRRNMLQLGAGALGAASGLAPFAVGAQAPALKTVKPGVLTAACTGDMPLTSLRDGKPIGTDLEMLGRIAERLGLKLEVQIVAFPAVVEAVQSGRADWFGGNFAWTPPRSQIMLLTDAVFYTSKFAIMRQSEPYKDSVSVADFAGRTIGSGVGYAFVPDMKKVTAAKEVKLYDGIDSCMRDIIAGRLDFAVLDAPVIDYMIQQNALALKQVPIVYDEAFPLLTRKNNAIWAMYGQNPDLYDAVNAGVAWLWKTGQIKEILGKYGITSPAYLEPVQPSPRLTIDRDASGATIGPFAHKARDFSSIFG